MWEDDLKDLYEVTKSREQRAGSLSHPQLNRSLNVAHDICLLTKLLAGLLCY